MFNFFRPKLNDPSLLIPDFVLLESSISRVRINPITSSADSENLKHVQGPSFEAITQTELVNFCREVIKRDPRSALSEIRQILDLVEKRRRAFDSSSAGERSMQRNLSDTDKQVAAKVIGRIFELVPQETKSFVLKSLELLQEDSKSVVISSLTRAKIFLPAVVPVIVEELRVYSLGRASPDFDPLSRVGYLEAGGDSFSFVFKDVQELLRAIESTRKSRRGVRGTSFEELILGDALVKITPRDHTSKVKTVKGLLESHEEKDQLLACRILKEDPQLVVVAQKDFMRLLSSERYNVTVSALDVLSVSDFSAMPSTSRAAFAAEVLRLAHEKDSPGEALFTLVKFGNYDTIALSLLRVRWGQLSAFFSDIRESSPTASPVSDIESDLVEEIEIALRSHRDPNVIKVSLSVTPIVKAVSLLKDRNVEAERLFRDIENHPSTIVQDALKRCSQ